MRLKPTLARTGGIDALRYGVMSAPQTPEKPEEQAPYSVEAGLSRHLKLIRTKQDENHDDPMESCV